MATPVINRPCILIIRDGWGENPDSKWDYANAAKLAQPPVDAMFREKWPWTLVKTSGMDVGLPEGTMGNSEVGHQNIGAGRIVDQDSVAITRAVRDGSFFDNAELNAAVENCIGKGTSLHIMGLASDIGVHSLLEHLYAIVELAARRGLERVFVHCLTDGRDSPPTSGIDYVGQIEDRLREIGVGKIASVSGRYWAMDRDNRWDRVERAYRMLVQGDAAHAPSAAVALRNYYDNPVTPNMVGDEFVVPTLVCDDQDRPLATIKDGDSIVFFNFRGDRPREITKALMFDEFPYQVVDKDGNETQMGFDRGQRLSLFYVTLTQYEKGLPVQVAFPKPPKMENIGGAYLSRLGLRQFRCAETEKYAHVTFFFNDYREKPFDGEERQLVASPKVATYDQQPEMSAYEVTKVVLDRIATGVDDFLVLNYANPDMIGHTGVLEAAVKACRVVDECVGRVYEAIMAAGGCGIVTADHGNFEQMIDPLSGGPHTAHTIWPVPLYAFGEPVKGARLRTDGRLADVMPTLLQMMGLPIPEEMTGKSLVL